MNLIKNSLLWSACAHCCSIARVGLPSRLASWDRSSSSTYLHSTNSRQNRHCSRIPPSKNSISHAAYCNRTKTDTLLIPEPFLTSNPACRVFLSAVGPVRQRDLRLAALVRIRGIIDGLIAIICCGTLFPVRLGKQDATRREIIISSSALLPYHRNFQLGDHGCPARPSFDILVLPHSRSGFVRVTVLRDSCIPRVQEP